MDITTIYGLMDESMLERREGGIDDGVETTQWIEYWLNGELVHRSAHVDLKKPALFADGAVQSF